VKKKSHRRGGGGGEIKGESVTKIKSPPLRGGIRKKHQRRR